MLVARPHQDSAGTTAANSGPSSGGICAISGLPIATSRRGARRVTAKLNVAIEPTRESVIVLATIVLVRTVLSLSIDVEIDGRWPWRAAEQDALVRAAQARDVASAETRGEPGVRGDR